MEHQRNGVSVAFTTFPSYPDQLLLNRRFRHKGYTGHGASLLRMEPCGVCNFTNLAICLVEAVYAAEVEWLDQQRGLWRKQHKKEGEGA